MASGPYRRSSARRRTLGVEHVVPNCSSSLRGSSFAASNLGSFSTESFGEPSPTPSSTPPPRRQGKGAIVQLEQFSDGQGAF